MGIKLKKNISKLFLAMFFTAGITSCGLDTFYLLKGPIIFYNRPELTNSDPVNNFVYFSTNENQNLTSDFDFTGTIIYYKIYGKYESVSTDISLIESRNNDSNYGAALDLIKSKGYRELRCDNNTEESFVINATGVNKNVKIRLTDYNLESDLNPSADNVPYIYINGVDTNKKPKRAERKNGQNLDFNFGRNKTDLNSPKPEPQDNDFDGVEPPDGVYYVNMYAVALGHDVTYKFYYSNLLYLGTIRINSNSEMNW